ncbi:hypothetical protein NMY22_g7384 [Coprinellus aureogranulatus]|nr:hypothetical protein NMY22_g7384 [Coprinellus aureogranulatus]
MSRSLPPNSLRRLFTVPVMHLFFLRCLMVLSFVDLLYSTATGHQYWNSANKAATVVSSVVLVHQLTIAFGPYAIIHVPVFVDVTLISLEGAGATYASWYMLDEMKDNGWQLRYYSALEAFWFITSWGLTVTLFLALLWKIGHVLLSEDWKTQLVAKVDIQQKGSREEPPSWTASEALKYGAKSLLGRVPWEKHIPLPLFECSGESSFISRLRGCLTLFVIIILLALGVYAILWQPLAELALTPLKTLHTEADEGPRTTSPFEWNLITMWKKTRAGEGNTTAPSLFDSASVAMLPPLDNPSGNACSRSLYDQDYGDFEIVIFRCGRNRGILNASLRKYSTPDLYLTVNFTNLLSSGRAMGNVTSIIDDAVQVLVGLTNNTGDVIKDAVPVPLFSGTNLLSIVTPYYMQRLQPPELATNYRTYLAADVFYTITDPLISPTERNSSLATLRVVACANIGNWVVVQEFRARSVLDGLSKIGGLGSLLSTLLVLLLGSSLAQTNDPVLAGSKPYSPFGVLHDKQKVLEACREDYPKLQEDLDRFQRSDQRGLIAFLLDTLIDISPAAPMTLNESHRADSEREPRNPSDVELVTYLPPLRLLLLRMEIEPQPRRAPSDPSSIETGRLLRTYFKDHNLPSRTRRFPSSEWSSILKEDPVDLDLRPGTAILAAIRAVGISWMQVQDMRATIDSTLTMNEIVPNLWLGDLLSALNTKMLREKGVRSVLSVMRGRVTVHETFIRHQVALDDLEDEDILVHMGPCIKFIEKELAKGHGVLVHCQAGVSRSATILTAYLMSTQNLTPTAALSLVRTKRPFIGPNPGFLAQLEVFHQAGYTVSRECKVVRTWGWGGEADLGTEAEEELLSSLSISSAGTSSSRSSATSLVQTSETHVPSSSGKVITTAHEASIVSGGVQEEVLISLSKAEAAKEHMKAKTKRRRVVRCRMCRCELAGRGDMLEHEHTSSESSLSPTSSLSASLSRTATVVNVHPSDGEDDDDEAETKPMLTNPKCSGYFVEPGKLLCPNKRCNAKLGNYTWVGAQCGCGGWAVPGFCLGRGKVEEVFIGEVHEQVSRGLRHIWGKASLKSPKRILSPTVALLIPSPKNP